jgi:hypothetical protein
MVYLVYLVCLFYLVCLVMGQRVSGLGDREGKRLLLMIL